MSVYRFVRTSTQVIDEDLVVLDFHETLENGPADERSPAHVSFYEHFFSIRLFHI